MNTWQVSAHPLSARQSAIDPYRFPAARDFDQQDRQETAQTTEGLGDYALSAPDPAERLDFSLTPTDSRRLALHATLTTAGIAPLPGDLDAISALCALNDTTVSTVVRWISTTAHHDGSCS